MVIWATIKKVFIFLSSLVMEEKVLSLSRTAFWLIFGLSYYKWCHDKPLPGGMLEVTFALLGYILFKKPIAIGSKYIQIKAMNNNRANNPAINDDSEPEA